MYVCSFENCSKGQCFQLSAKMFRLLSQDPTDQFQCCAVFPNPSFLINFERFSFLFCGQTLQKYLRNEWIYWVHHISPKIAQQRMAKQRFIQINFTGIVLYELLTGTLPYCHISDKDQVTRHIEHSLMIFLRIIPLWQTLSFERNAANNFADSLHGGLRLLEGRYDEVADRHT